MSGLKIELPYQPQPRQARAHVTTAQEILYGGAAGGGKSAFLRWDAVDFCINLPKFFAVIFRRTFPQLRRNHIRPLQLALPSQIAEWNETNKEFRFFNESVLVMRHLEQDKDCDDIQGWELHYAGIDEAGQLTPYQINYIKSRLRLGDYRRYIENEAKDNPRMQYYLDRLPRLALASNPGGISHHYLKQNYIDPAPPEDVFTTENGKTRVFIPARMTDNEHLESDYELQFSEMPAWQRKQLVLGDWNVIPGAFFDCFNTALHVVTPFEIPLHWKRFRSMDWGFATPFSIGWWAISDGQPIIAKDGDTYEFPEGAIIRYREWYGAKQGKRGYVNQGLRMAPEDVAETIRRKDYGETFAYSVADPSIWRSDGGESVAEKFRRCGVTWRPAANDRNSGCQLMYSRIRSNQLFVFDTCTEFIRTVPAAVSDDKKPEEYAKEGEDHITDEVRYACASRPRAFKRDDTPPYHARLPTMDDINGWSKPKAEIELI